MINVVIIEDEPSSLQNVINLLDKHCPEVEVIGTGKSNADLINLLENQELKPDAVLLDIKLPDGLVFEGLNGLDVDFDFDVIFISAFNEYALRAFDAAAIDYVLKPILPADLQRAISRIKKRDLQTRTKERLEVFQNIYQPGPNPIEKISISSVDGIQLVKLKDIIRLEGDDNYTFFFLTGKEKITTSRNIGSYSTLLEELNFVRVHKGDLVNVNHIKSYIKGEGGSVIMDNGDEVIVARRRKPNLMKILRNLFGDL